MRYLIFLFIVSTLPICAQSPANWVLDEDSFGKYDLEAVQILQDSLILISSVTRYTACPFRVLSAYDFEGRRKWKKIESGGVLHVSNNALYTAAYYSGDDLLGYSQVQVMGFDEKGHELLNIGFPEVPHEADFYFRPIGMTVLSNMNVWLISEDSAILLGKDGSLLAETNFNLPQAIRGLQRYDDNLFVLSTKSTVYLMDSTFTLLDSILFENETIADIDLYHDDLFILFPNRLIRLNRSLEILDTIETDESKDWIRLKVFDDSLWLQNDNQASIELMQIDNIESNEVILFSKLGENNDFVIFNDRFVFVGDSPSGQVQLYSHEPNNEHLEIELSDIAITNLDYQVNSIDSFVLGNGEVIITGYEFDSDISVLNKGPFPIHSLAIFSILDGGFNCGAPRHIYRTFNNLSVAVGEIYTINFVNVYQGGSNAEVCFEVLAPNSMIEIFVEDNRLCMDNIISATDDVIRNGDYQVYPNPAETKINVSTTSQINGWEIVNLNGVVVKQSGYSMAISQDVNIDVSELNDGMYFLNLHSNGNTRILKKVIIQK